tara:strand:+ start:179 stop:352 length:174 start_codon:yes stop_codon:yes gene_type:complete
MTKEQASREWLELNRMQKTIRIKRVGETNHKLVAHYSVILEELEHAKQIFKELIDPE